MDVYPIPRIHDLVHEIAKYKVFSQLDLKNAYYQVPLKEEEKLFTAFEADGQLFHYNRVPFGLTNAVSAFQRIMNTITTDNNLSATYAYIDDVIICGNSQEEHDRNLKNFKDITKKYNITLNESKCHYSLKKINYLGYTIANGSLCPDPERLKPLMNLPAPWDPASLRRTLGLLSYYSQWIPNYSSRIQPLLGCKDFPINSEAARCLDSLKDDIGRPSLAAWDEDPPLEVETDASDNSLGATLSQVGRPIAFFS